MNVQMSYKLRKTSDIEKHVNHFVTKLGKRLRDFRPGLVHLRGLVERSSPREGTCVSLNLRLPTGQMAAQESAEHSIAAIKGAFEELLSQVGKHKDRLRSSSKWPRWRRGSNGRSEPGVPFENTFAVVHPPIISSDDISAYLHTNLNRLDHVIEHELSIREPIEWPHVNWLTKEEVMDETIARALSDGIDKPERAVLEPWLCKLAKTTIDDLVSRDGESGEEIHLEESVRQRNEKASSEPQLQFHQSDESFTEETIIADRHAVNPEVEAYSEEILALVQRALYTARRNDREAFILYALEGFSVDEIAVITHRTTAETLACIESAREHLRHSPPLANSLHMKLLVNTEEN
jgi:DNA-directed RNA polymerase specialized sigma24 family protein/ribosome-associated translation inhibitor RaiA